MSAEQFSKLSLEGEMVTTRAGAARAARSESGSSSDASQDQPLPTVESPASTSPVPPLVISTNNLQYNVSSFDSDLRQRVKMGLEDNEIKMKYCTLATNRDESGTKQFYIDGDITVSIGGELQSPKCTCGANEKGLACKVSALLTMAVAFADRIAAYLLVGRSNTFNSYGSSQREACPVLTRWVDHTEYNASRSS
jgi:hypothetical protein